MWQGSGGVGGEFSWDWPGPEVEQGAQLSWDCNVLGEVVVSRRLREGCSVMLAPGTAGEIWLESSRTSLCMSINKSEPPCVSAGLSNTCPFYLQKDQVGVSMALL